MDDLLMTLIGEGGEKHADKEARQLTITRPSQDHHKDARKQRVDESHSRFKHAQPVHCQTITRR